MTPATTSGGRAERSREFANSSAAAPVTKKSGARQAAASDALRDHRVIQALAEAPKSDENSAKTGMRTRPSEAASSEFLSRNAAASLMPLAANGSFRGSSARAAKATSKTNATEIRIRVATIAHHTPASTARTSDRVRCRAAEPTAPSSANVKNTGVMTKVSSRNKQFDYVVRHEYGTQQQASSRADTDRAAYFRAALAPHPYRHKAVH